MEVFLAAHARLTRPQQQAAQREWYRIARAHADVSTFARKVVEGERAPTPRQGFVLTRIAAEQMEQRRRAR